MDGNLITIEIWINGVLFKPVWINIGYECYFIMDEDFMTEWRLPRVKISPKFIISFIKENIKEPWVKITKIIKFFINI